MEPGAAKQKTATDDYTPLSLPDLSGLSEPERSKLKLEILKLQVDTYKWRAEEYRGRYEGLRTLEWNTILQMYAGYAGIALAFKYLDEKPHNTWQPLAWIAIFGTSIFYFATRYLNYRIQERLIRFGQTLETYSDRVGELLHIDPPHPGTASLRHHYYWTYDIQFVLSTVTFVGLIGYELHSIVTVDHLKLAFFILLAIAVALSVIGLTKYTPTKRMKSSLVWYASYGSNLKRQRFMCYIEGGVPEGRTIPNEGCRDVSPPTKSSPISLPFDLYFAAQSSSWGEGGVAFIRNGARDSNTLGRMYLITDEQFNDVVMQENSKPVDGSRFVRPFEQLVRQHDFLLPGNPWYGKVLNIGTEGGYPILTFTTARTDLQPNPNAPSEQYLKTIASGIKETYPKMTDSEIAAYLLGADGIRGNIDPGQIDRWIREV